MVHHASVKRHQEGIRDWVEKPGAQCYVYMVLCYLCAKREWKKQISIIVFTYNYIKKFWKEM